MCKTALGEPQAGAPWWHRLQLLPTHFRFDWLKRADKQPNGLVRENLFNIDHEHVTNESNEYATNEPDGHEISSAGYG